MLQNDTPRAAKQIVSLDLRWVVALLLVIIGCMLFIWQPWDSTKTEDQTITVNGDATIKAAPDQFSFYPLYRFENSDKSAALDALSKKSDELTAKLKELGVTENHIKTNAGSNDFGPIKTETADTTTYTLRLTVTVENRELAQKVQDYLLTTKPTGDVTPQPTFSESKRKELEAQAREQAIEDARARANSTAKNLGFKLGKVKTVSDGSGFWALAPSARDSATASNLSMEPSLSLYPGENELPYSISVVYYVR